MLGRIAGCVTLHRKALPDRLFKKMPEDARLAWHRSCNTRRTIIRAQDRASVSLKGASNRKNNLMLKRLIQTGQDYALTISRLVLGVIFFAHGGQLMLGWFGGYGLSGSMQFFTRQLGIPSVFAFMAIAGQFFGGIMLIAGLAGRAAALTIACIMAVAVVKVHWRFGFFMNWFGAQKGEGFEYHLLAIGLGLVVVLGGSGAFSLDRLLLKWRGSSLREPAGLGRTAASTENFC
jgi:putative oxidoreductase